MAQRTKALVAVTLGADGVRWVDGDSVRSQPAFAVDVADTLGAGDVSTERAPWPPSND